MLPLLIFFHLFRIDLAISWKFDLCLSADYLEDYKTQTLCMQAILYFMQYDVDEKWRNIFSFAYCIIAPCYYGCDTKNL